MGETNQPAGSELQPQALPRMRATERREIFWQNVTREILNSLAAAAAASAGRLGATPSAAAAGGSPTAELFDGRMAVITRLGQRIPIADVVPVFACSTNPRVAEGTGAGPNQGRTPHEQRLADDVQCTVFQIRTPTGEVYTLPVSEIASIHALSEQLIQKLAEAAQAENSVLEGGADGAEAAVPFGFAAFTSLARSQEESETGEG